MKRGLKKSNVPITYRLVGHGWCILSLFSAPWWVEKTTSVNKDNELQTQLLVPIQYPSVLRKRRYYSCRCKTSYLCCSSSFHPIPMEFPVLSPLLDIMLDRSARVSLSSGLVFCFVFLKEVVFMNLAFCQNLPFMLMSSAKGFPFPSMQQHYSQPPHLSVFTLSSQWLPVVTCILLGLQRPLELHQSCCLPSMLSDSTDCDILQAHIHSLAGTVDQVVLVTFCCLSILAMGISALSWSWYVSVDWWAISRLQLRFLFFQNSCCYHQVFGTGPSTPSFFFRHRLSQAKIITGQQRSLDTQFQRLISELRIPLPLDPDVHNNLDTLLLTAGKQACKASFSFLYKF